jgi:hypothetical protein
MIVSVLPHRLKGVEKDAPRDAVPGCHNRSFNDQKNLEAAARCFQPGADHGNAVGQLVCGL